MTIEISTDRSTTLAAATQARILDRNPKRVSAIIVNISGGPVYLAKTGGGTTSGIYLANGSGYEINLTNPWHGPLYAYSAAGGAITVLEDSQ